VVKQPMSDVVVLVPGILGSVLARDGQDVWAPTPGAIGRALWSLGRNVKGLELTSDPWEVDDLGDGVTAPRVMPDVHIIPGLWGIDGYSGIKRMITERFDAVPGETYLELPYDWRRDNRVAARALRRLADEKLHAARQQNPDAKLVLIGHSMGGLVARYFLECLDGWRDTRMLVTFGTPHRGSLNAVDFLVNGFVKKLGPLRLVDLTDLLRSLTSVYQLLPTYPCVDRGDGYLPVADASLPGVDVAKARTALEDFHGAIDAGTGAHDPGVYALHSVVGITQGTKQSARRDGDRVVCEEIFEGTDRGGDGTVPRMSATPAETDGWKPAYQPMYSADRHASLQNADPVQTQLYGILTAQLVDVTRSFLGVRLDAPEVVDVGESVTLRALPDGANLTLVASVTDLATGRQVGEPMQLRRDADEVHHGEVPPLPEGDYRINVVGVGDSADLVDPVHGLVCVISDAEPITESISG
jgi:pimeloyl-ACP methyl ester carboxylesterase